MLSIISIEKVNIANLMALCHSKKLQEWDNVNFPVIAKLKKNTQQPIIEEQKRENNGKTEFIRHHINSIKNYAEIAIANNGHVEITYSANEFGRFKNVNPYGKCYSFSNMYGELRNLLAYDKYDDFDIKNCHYVLFYNMCIQKEFNELNYIKEYIDSRNDIFNNLIKDNPDAIDPETKEKLFFKTTDDQKKILKKIFTSILNNASLSKIKIEYNLINNLTFIENLYKQLQKNLKKIIDLDENKKLNDSVIKKKHAENDTHNIEGAIISTILQTKEREALCIFRDLVINDNFIVGALIHDGLHIEKNREITQQILTKWNIDLNKKLYNIINNNLIKIEIVNKPIIIDDSFLIPDDETIKYNYHKKILENKGFALIKSQSCYMSNIEGNIDLFNEDELITKYKTYMFKINNKPFIKYWINDPSSKQYDRIEFIPKRNNSPNVFNTFDGFEIEKYNFKDLPQTQESRKLEILPLLTFLFDIAGRNEQQYKTLLNYTSHILVKPYKKVKIAIIMKGTKQGMGKNTYFLMMQRILGHKYCTSTPDIDSIFGKFANIRQDKLFICINEASFAETKKYQGKMKDAITEDTFTLELKNINKTTYNSFENYVIYSQEFNCVEIEAENRRFFVIDLDIVKFDNKKEIFNNIYKNFLGDKDTEPNWRKLHIFFEYMKQYFLDNNVSNYNFEENIKTQESEILKTIDPLKEFMEMYLVQQIQANYDLLTINIPTKTMFDEYIKYLKSLNMQCEKLSVPTFSKLILSKFKTFIDNVRESHCRKYIVNFKNGLEYFNIDIKDVNNIIFD